MRILVLISVLFLCAFIFPVAVRAEVLINEILPDTVSSGDKSEWIELFNTGTEPVDLRGWSLDGKLIENSEAVIIPPRGFFIFTKDLAEFAIEFGALTNIKQLGISLPNTSDTVELRHDDYVDSVGYSETSPSKSWERLGQSCAELRLNTTGNTLSAPNQNIDPNCAAGNPILDIRFSPDNSIWFDTLARIGPVNVYFTYELEPGVNVISEVWLTDSQQVLTNPAELTNYISRPITLKVVTDRGEFSKTTNGLNIVPKLTITEFMPNPDGVDANNEWLEIYNPNNFEVNLKGYKIMDGDRELLSFGESDRILAGGYVVINLPGSVLLNCENTNGCEDGLSLRFSDLLLSEFRYTNSEVGKSWTLNERGEWVMSTNSPGVINSSASVSSTDSVLGKGTSSIESSLSTQSHYLIPALGIRDIGERRETHSIETLVYFWPFALFIGLISAVLLGAEWGLWGKLRSWLELRLKT